MARPTFALLIAALVASCSPTDPSESSQLQANMAKWDARGVATYQIVLQRGACECLAEEVIPIRVSVTGEDISSVIDERTGEVVTRELFHARTVEGLFDLIHDALAAGAYSVIVSYDRQLGYPREISIDYQANVADDEIIIIAELVPTGS